MSDPKKPDPTGVPTTPEQMSYPTPELDPATGAPLDTRFQNDASKEVSAEQQAPKSGEAKSKKDEDEDEDDKKAPKGKEKPSRR